MIAYHLSVHNSLTARTLEIAKEVEDQMLSVPASVSPRILAYHLASLAAACEQTLGVRSYALPGYLTLDGPEPMAFGGAGATPVDVTGATGATPVDATGATGATPVDVTGATGATPVDVTGATGATPVDVTGATGATP